MQKRKDVLANRTFAMCLKRTFTFVPPERGSPITTPPKRMEWFYADTGPMPVKAAPSNIAVPLQKSDGSHDGSMRTFSSPSNVFLMKTLPRVASEMALHVLAYNLTRVMNIMGIGPLLAAIRA